MKDKDNFLSEYDTIVDDIHDKDSPQSDDLQVLT